MKELFTVWDQGWMLTTLSSCLCVFGCFVIFIDDIYYAVFPKSITGKYKFEIKENYTFLCGSLAFSSGCLLFTSLFRLLPEAIQYLLNSAKESGDVSPHMERKLNFILVASYIGGMLLTILSNTILHLITSESVVHCSHSSHEHSQEPESGDSNSLSHHNCSQIHHHSDDETDNHSYNGTHGHSNEYSHARGHSEGHEHRHQDYFDGSFANEQHRTALETIPSNASLTEHAPLTESHRPSKIKRSSSLLHFLSHDKENKEMLGECRGYSSAELCLYHNQMHNNESTPPKNLHFCELPTLTSNASNEMGDYGSTSDNDDIRKPSSLQTADVHDELSEGETKHHHHVTSPFGRLFLIGIQTSLAITLHKLPEGFITYITSETNPKLGMSIFLSLLLHNLTEGFSMCLPLYYLFASTSRRFAKLRAITISAFLGGLSQPLGAFFGYIFMHTYAPGGNIDLSKLNLVFGSTLAVTGGFLTVIGLSMYGSAVSFGGSLNFVMIWCIVGISTIALSFMITSG
ncbi:uncharacterized protein PRCAT00001206001 [Priceomyces carsonii]|uniref:uncharacterized protein n=1 Tax=Priceomyces carsonii TaxID=28549 RepID=UPI002ED97EF9|nr:unnamed protein product [Priceomyces carsonii]